MDGAGALLFSWLMNTKRADNLLRSENAGVVLRWAPSEGVPRPWWPEPGGTVDGII